MKGALNCSPTHLAAFICSLVLEAASSPISSSGIDPSRRSSATPIASSSSCNASRTAVSPGSLSLTTSVISTDAHGQMSWTFAVPDFPASPSPKLDAMPVSMTPDTSGPLPSGWFARYDPASSTWKTCQDSLLTQASDDFSGIWPQQAMMHDGACWEQTMLAHRITVRGSGFWHTAEGMIPRSMGSTRLKTLDQDPQVWSTPRQSDWRSGKVSARTRFKNTRPLPEQVGGLLNPEWVEWLMAWPIGWSDLKPLATAKFHWWRQQLGVYSTDRSSQHSQS